MQKNNTFPEERAKSLKQVIPNPQKHALFQILTDLHLDKSDEVQNKET